MRITRVEAENLKGRSFAHDLSPEVAIAGENFTGKTSIIDAIRLGLIGYIPELGKLPKATRQLMSGEFMTVHLEFDNGSNADFETNGKQEHEVEWRIDRKEIPLLNAAAYFAMSERERYQYVFNIAKIPEGFTAKSILDELRMIRFEQVHTPEALTQVVTFMAKPLEAMTIQEGLQRALEDLAQHFKYYNSRTKDTQGAVRVLTELKNQQEAMAGNAKQFAEVERLAREEAQTAYKALRDLQDKAHRAVEFQKRRERMKKLAEAVSNTEETEKLERLIAETSKQLKPVVDCEYSENDVLTYRKMVTEDTSTFEEFARKLADAQSKLRDVQGMKACPYCGAEGTLETLVAALNEAIEFNDGAKAGAARRLEFSKDRLTKIEAEVKKAREDLAHNRLLNERIIGWDAQIEKLLKQRDAWNTQLEKEEKELAESEVDPVSKEQLDEAEANNQKAEATYKEARAKLKTAELLEQDIKRAAQAQIEHETAQAYVVVIKEVGKILREKQASLVTAVFGDLLHVANGIVGELLRSDLAFHEGEVGRWSGHQWISNKTFTGAEQALTFVAIAAALSQGAPIRLLIFDELGRLDKANRALLMNVLHRALQDGWIDQWIIAGTNDSMPEAFGADVQLIEL